MQCAKEPMPAEPVYAVRALTTAQGLIVAAAARSNCRSHEGENAEDN